jgi:hypothetical protein
MSMNYAFGFSLFLLLLVGLNIYFFYTLNTVERQGHGLNVPNIKLDLSTDAFKDIYQYLTYLPSVYKQKNPRYTPIQRSLLQSFNTTNFQDAKNALHNTVNVSHY